MVASRLSLYFVLFFTLAVAIATPITRPGGKRASVSDVKAVLNTLKASTDQILPQIDDLVSTGAATGDTITPLVGGLTSALDSAASTLSTFQAIAVTGPELNEIATLLADITNSVAATLDGVPTGAVWTDVKNFVVRVFASVVYIFDPRVA